MLTRRPQRRVRPPPQPIFDDFKPREEWIQEPSNYILRLYLPQVFKAEDFNVIYDQSGKITVRGTKQVGENRFSRFESSYNVPIDSNLEKISGTLENNILALTIPKIIAVKPSEEKKQEPVLEKAKIVKEESKEEEKLTLPKEKPVMAEEERKEAAVIKEKIDEQVMSEAMQRINEKVKEAAMQKPNALEEKKEELALKEKSKMVAEERKEEESLKEIKEKLTVPKEKQMMAEEEKKEESVIKEKIEEPALKIMNEAMQRIDEKINESAIQRKPNALEEKKEEQALKEKSKMLAEESKQEEPLKDIKEKPIVPKEKPMTVEEERKESTVLKETKEEPMKAEMAMEEPIWEKRKDKADPNELKKEEHTVKEKQDPEEKHETIQKDKQKCFDGEKKEDSAEKEVTWKDAVDGEKKEDSGKKEETWEDAVTRKPRYCHETRVQEKQPKEKESKKRSWLCNEEDKGWLDWLDGAFIDDVLKKVYRNKKFITLALVVFSTGFFISRKLRKRG